MSQRNLPEWYRPALSLSEPEPLCEPATREGYEYRLQQVAAAEGLRVTHEQEPIKESDLQLVPLDADITLTGNEPADPQQVSGEYLERINSDLSLMAHNDYPREPAVFMLRRDGVERHYQRSHKDEFRPGGARNMDNPITLAADMAEREHQRKLQEDKAKKSNSTPNPGSR